MGISANSSRGGRNRRHLTNFYTYYSKLGGIEHFFFLPLLRRAFGIPSFFFFHVRSDLLGALHECMVFLYSPDL